MTLEQVAAGIAIGLLAYGMGKLYDWRRGY